MLSTSFGSTFYVAIARKTRRFSTRNPAKQNTLLFYIMAQALLLRIDFKKATLSPLG